MSASLYDFDRDNVIPMNPPHRRRPQPAPEHRRTAGAPSGRSPRRSAPARSSSHKTPPRRRARRRRHPVLPLLFAVLLLFGVPWLVRNRTVPAGNAPDAGGAPVTLPPDGAATLTVTPAPTAKPTVPDWITVDLLPVNEYSRPGEALEQVNGVVVHYVGNPGTTARQNRSYFGHLAQTHETYASSHFVVGMDGEVIQCVPLEEISYCSSSRNSDTIAIECCHPDESGAFTAETAVSLKKLLNWLIEIYGLERDDILRHYDVTGKECPVYYVKHPDAWEGLLDQLIFSPSSGNAAQPDDWQLTLVNWETPLAQSFEVPSLTQLDTGNSIDNRIYTALQNMLDGARSAGFQPMVCSSFRSWDKQEELFLRQVQVWLNKGYSQTAAEEEAARWVARPGTSEHQLGLAVDIVDQDYQILDEAQENRPVQQWLMAHCAEYGFILRYPSGKSELTGVEYEPWHYRYVGEQAAAAIMSQGLCLEEYLGNL